MSTATLNSTERVPRADDAERYCLGCLIAFPDCATELFELLQPSDFFDLEHQQIFAAATKQFAAGGIDPVLLGKETKQPKLLVDLGLNPHNAPVTDAHIPAEAAKIVEARRKRDRLVQIEEWDHKYRNGHPTADIDRDLFATANDWLRERGEIKPRFTAITAAEFDCATYEQHFLIDSVMAEFAPMIAAAARKGMKTSVLMDYSIAQAAGGHFLGYFPTCGKRRVLFCSGESGLPTLQETARRICQRAGYELGRLENLVVSTDLPNVGSGDSLEDFRTFISDQGAEVVIVDPAYLCFPAADAGNLFAQGDLLRGLNNIIAEQNATLILVHHTKKQIAEPYGTPELENIAWAGFQEYARQWWLLGRREAYEPGSGVHRLWFNVGGSAGHGNLFAVDIDEGRRDDPSGRKWEVTVVKASEARHAAQQRKSDAQMKVAAEQFDADCDAIRNMLVSKPDGATKTFVREACGVSGRRFPSVFSSMVESGELVPCEVTVSNHKTPRAGFKLGVPKVS